MQEAYLELSKVRLPMDGLDDDISVHVLIDRRNNDISVHLLIDELNNDVLTFDRGLQEAYLELAKFHLLTYGLKSDNSVHLLTGELHNDVSVHLFIDGLDNEI